MSITPKNWQAFQHYKDRAPPWIKLHHGLLDNIEYHRLSPLAGKCLPLIWLVASEKDGVVPDYAELAWRLRVSVAEAKKVVTELLARDFLIDDDTLELVGDTAGTAQQIAEKHGFGNRYIPNAVKHEVWRRDGGKCCRCGSTERLEYDHKVPVSKGGNSDADNVQLLCRACNRSKRVTVAGPAEHVATQTLGTRRLEESRGEVEERRLEERREKRHSGKKEGVKNGTIIEATDRVIEHFAKAGGVRPEVRSGEGPNPVRLLPKG